MPCINAKFSVPLDAEKKDALKTDFGKAILVMGKPETYLMVCLEENAMIYFGGKKLERGAFVEVSALGQIDSGQSRKMSAEICDILKRRLDIPGECVYITYQGYKDWGWNGGNF